MRAAKTLTLGITATGLVGGGLSALVLAPSAHATGGDATLRPSRGSIELPFVTPSGRTMKLRPDVFALDTDADGRADTWGYCVQPFVLTPKDVISGQRHLTTRTLDYAHADDMARVSWVVNHGATRHDAKEAANTLGVSLDGLSEKDALSAMQDATQAAVWHFAAGLEPGGHYRYGIAGKTVVFKAAYAAFVAKAQAEAVNVVIWGEKEGDAATQGVVVPGPKPGPTPTETTPAPVPTTTVPVPGPTKTTDVPLPPKPTTEVPLPPSPTVTETPTETPTPTPTGSETPTPTGSETPTPTPTETSPTPAPSTSTPSTDVPQTPGGTTDAPSPSTTVPGQDTPVTPEGTPTAPVVDSGVPAADGGPNVPGIVVGGALVAAAAGGIITLAYRSRRSTTR